MKDPTKSYLSQVTNDNGTVGPAASFAASSAATSRCLCRRLRLCRCRHV